MADAMHTRDNHVVNDISDTQATLDLIVKRVKTSSMQAYERSWKAKGYPVFNKKSSFSSKHSL